MIEEKYRLSGNKLLAFTPVSSLQINADDVFVNETNNTVDDQLSILNKKTSTNFEFVEIQSGSLTIDLSLSNTFIVSLTENVTNVNIYGFTPGTARKFTLLIVQGGTNTFATPSGWKFPSILGPYIATSGENAVDILEIALYGDDTTPFVSYNKNYV